MNPEWKFIVASISDRVKLLHGFSWSCLQLSALKPPTMFLLSNADLVLTLPGVSLTPWQTEKVRRWRKQEHNYENKNDFKRKNSEYLFVTFPGEVNGYNIPEVTSAPDVSKWFTEEGVNYLKSCTDDKKLPMHAKRLICDGYMCFYQSPDVMMYQWRTGWRN